MTPWILRTPQAAPAMRLICFAYAGGNARMYAQWQAALGPEIEVWAVQLPGRGTRRSEEPFTSLAELIAVLSDILRPEDQLPFMFFGHSLGALIAFELTRHFAAHDSRLPDRLMVSAANAPGRRNRSRGLHTMGDDELIEQLRGFNGTPPAVMKYRELLVMALPAIRADFAVSETYQYRAGPRLPVPLTVLAGRGDPLTSNVQIEAWACETSAPCEVHWFDGDHFFINEQEAAVLELIRLSVAASSANA
ncbi:alpha/beta fold hydrolase [Massilia sp. PAMC28688]|nr:alpha/beta fold hydrolase [Massilia sp. PAMC28688]